MTAQERHRLRAKHDCRMERGIHWRGDHAPTQAERDLIAMACRKARYGHRNWLCWRDRESVLHVAVQTAASIKQALLDTGTQYAFTQIGANDGWHMIVTWPIGLNMLRQTKWGI